MSIHVISAVLKCRDKDLTSSRRMVLVSLANYAGEDGRAWPSQQLIADESGCGLRSVKDHLKWLDENGFLSRTTKKLGQGNGSRTSYQIHLDKLSGTEANRGAEFAGAEFARANSVVPKCSIPPFTNRQEPSVKDTNVSLGAQSADTQPEQPKRKVAKKTARRASRISDNWAPTPKDYAYATSKGLTPQEINDEADRFRNHWISATKNPTKLDWEATWRTWITKPEFGPVARKQRQAARAGRGSSMASALDRVADQLEFGAYANAGREELHRTQAHADGFGSGGQAEIIDANGDVLARRAF